MMKVQECLEELMFIDTTEWNNIPKPLINAICSMKKCIFIQMQTIAENSDKVLEIEKLTEIQQKEFDGEIKNITKTIITNDDYAKQNLKDTNDTIEAMKINLSLIQTSLTSEIEYLRKHNEGKTSYLEQKIESIHKILTKFPTVDEVDDKIKDKIRDSSTRLRREIKDDVKFSIVDIEVGKIYEALKGNINNIQR